jgi:hypothetical protein
MNPQLENMAANLATSFLPLGNLIKIILLANMISTYASTEYTKTFNKLAAVSAEILKLNEFIIKNGKVIFTSKADNPLLIF